MSALTNKSQHQMDDLIKVFNKLAGMADRNMTASIRIPAAANASIFRTTQK